MAIQGPENPAGGSRAPDALYTFELPNKAYSLYISQNSQKNAKLLSAQIATFENGRRHKCNANMQISLRP